MLLYLVDHDIRLPDRVWAGRTKGDVRWNQPNRATLSDMLRHPAYAGAYVHGRRHHDGRLRLSSKPHSGRRFLLDPQRWSVLHQGALPAYIDWATFQRNQEQTAANRARYSGTPHGGAALLGDLVTCGLCGQRMFTTYNEDYREARYICHQMATTFGHRSAYVRTAYPDRIAERLQDRRRVLMLLRSLQELSNRAKVP